MVGCSIRNCKSRSEKGSIIRFYSFPKKESVANEWLRYCGLKTTCKNGRVCSKHFTSSDYINKPLQHILMKESPRKVRKLKPDVIPTFQIDSVEKSNSTDLTAKSTVCTETGGQTDNCETKENYDISAPSCNINLKAAVHIKSESDTTPAYNVEGSSNVVEESDKKIITMSEAEYNVLKRKSDEYEVLKNNVKQIFGESSSAKKIIIMSEAEYNVLKKKVDEYEVLKNNVKQIFTSGQIRCLTKPDRQRVRWSADDIAAAISLRSISPKGYRHLRATVGIPLPAYSTLCKWASKFDIKAGVLKKNPNQSRHLQVIREHKEKKKLK